MKLIKMSLTVGYDCRPELESMCYEDELNKEGKAYEDRDNRSDKRAIDLGRIWLEYDGNGKRPFWAAKVIVKDDGDKGVLRSLVPKLYDSMLELVKWNTVSFIKKVEELKTPGDDEIDGILNTAVNGAPGSKSIGLDEFKGAIMSSSRTFGMQLAGLNGDSEDFAKFFDAIVTDDIINVLIKNGLIVLKIKGDYVMFDNEAAMNASIEAVSKKVSADVYARYCEKLDT